MPPIEPPTPETPASSATAHTLGWVIATAVPAELAPIARALKIDFRQAQTRSPHPFFPGFAKVEIAGHPVALGCLGMGRPDVWGWAERLAPQMLAGILVLGFAGALAPDLAAGDLLIADDIRTLGGDPQWHIVPSSKWRTRAGEILTHDANALRGRFGRLLTVDEVVREPRAKAVLFARTQAAAVDMETAGMAEAAARAGVRFLSVRAIFDTATDRLPDVDELANAHGATLAWRLAKLALTRPRTFAALPGLGRRAAICGRSLGGFIAAWFRDLPVRRVAAGDADDSSSVDMPPDFTLPNPLLLADDDASAAPGDFPA